MTPPPRNPVGPRPRPRSAPGRVATQPRPAVRRAPARRARPHQGFGHVPPRRPARPRARRGRPERRLRLGLSIALVLMLTVSLRLVQLQGFNGAKYAQAAADSRSSTFTIAPTRGTITDRNGQPLAITVDARSVFANPNLVKQDVAAKHNPADTAAALAPLLGIPAADILTKITKVDSKFQYLVHGLTPAQGDAVTALVGRLQLTGIGVEADKKREYPAGSLASNVIGFVGSDGTPWAGYELALNDLLSGKPGSQSGEMGLGTVIPAATNSYLPPVPGTGVQLTIDRDIQWRAQQLLADQVKATGARGGYATVMDVKSGEVLALAVAPTFDANNPGAAPVDVRGNAAVSSVYEPGSVSKVITMAAAIQAGETTPTSEWTVPENIKVLGHTFNDAEHHKVEHLTTAGCLAKSSNVCTIQVAQKLGKDRLYA
ncbi:MAG: hypothetical protein QOG52_1660, partial [Frankiaceae bacterium]|nr:hypothetical protein [Frankiaceae bacterium]